MVQSILYMYNNLKALLISPLSINSNPLIGSWFLWYMQDLCHSKTPSSEINPQTCRKYIRATCHIFYESQNHWPQKASSLHCCNINVVGGKIQQHYFLCSKTLDVRSICWMKKRVTPFSIKPETLYHIVTNPPSWFLWLNRVL